MQRTPETINMTELEKELSAVRGAKGIHDLHVWQLGSGAHVGTLHVECAENTDFMDLATRLKRVLHSKDVHLTTIQPEFTNKDVNSCVLRCNWKKGEEDTCSLLKDGPKSSEDSSHELEVEHIHEHVHIHGKAEDNKKELAKPKKEQFKGKGKSKGKKQKTPKQEPEPEDEQRKLAEDEKNEIEKSSETQVM